MTGAEITLLSRTMANGRPTFCWVARPKPPGAGRVETEGHDRFIGALVEARLGVNQILTRHEGARLQKIGG